MNKEKTKYQFIFIEWAIDLLYSFLLIALATKLAVGFCFYYTIFIWISLNIFLEFLKGRFFEKERVSKKFFTVWPRNLSFTLIFVFNYFSYPENSVIKGLIWSILMIPDIFILYFFLFGCPISLFSKSTSRVEMNDLYDYFKKICDQNNIRDFSLKFTQATGNDEVDYNLCVDNKNNLVMGEKFYKTDEISLKDKFSLIAHEIGHIKYKDAEKLNLIKKILLIILIFAYCVFFYKSPISFELTIFVFGLLLLIRSISLVALNILSVMQEHIADDFSVLVAGNGPENLIFALQYVSEKASITYKTNWWHKLFLADHPSIYDRVRRIKSLIVEEK